MKNIALIVALLMLAGAGAIAGYDYFVVQPRNLELQATVEQIKTQADAQDNKANELLAASEDLESSIKVAQQDMQKMQSKADDQQKQARISALLADAFAKAQTHKVSVVEYYQTNMQWPNTSADIGLTDPAGFAGQAVQSIGVEKNGVIRIRFNERLKSGVSIFLIPSANSETYQIQWRCDAKELESAGIAVDVCK
jgi:hypothetical protein